VADYGGQDGVLGFAWFRKDAPQRTPADQSAISSTIALGAKVEASERRQKLDIFSPS